MQVPRFVLTHSTIRDTSMWHFYLLVAAWASVYTAMNVAVVLFLHDALGSIFLAGLALAVGSIFALCFDGIFAHFQTVYSPRTLFLNSIFGMILAVFLFLIGNHPTFVYLAAIIFRISYDLCDITGISYVLKRSHPQEYGQNLSYRQLAQGIGLITGFLVSAILLWTATFIGNAATTIVEMTGEIVNAEIDSDFLSALIFVKIFLLILLFIMWGSAYLLFDREHDLSRESIKAGFQEVEEKAAQNVKQTAEKLKQSLPFLRKKDATQSAVENENLPEKQKTDIRDLFGHIASAVNDLSLVGTKRPIELPLVWSMVIMCIFSYWDTFLGTFMPIYLTEVMREQTGWVQNLPGSIIMFILIIPVLVFLPLVAKWGDRHGRQILIIVGLALTMFSALVISFIKPNAFFLLLSAGFGITFGYLFVMSAVKADTASKMNEFMKKERQGIVIDHNASAGSMLLVDNIGNIIGTLLGGALIQLLGFNGLFFAFAFLLAVIIGLTIWKYSRITGEILAEPKAIPETQDISIEH